MLATGGGKVPSPISNEVISRFTDTQKRTGEEMYLRSEKNKADLKHINAQTLSIAARDAVAAGNMQIKALDIVVKDLINASVLGQITDTSQINGLPTTAQNRVEIGALKLKKELGLNEKVNEEAYGIALAEHGSMPPGKDKVNAILSTYSKNGGKANIDFLKGISEANKAPYEQFDIGGGITAVTVGGSTRIFDNKNKVADINNIEKDTYTKVLSQTAQEYESWDKMPVELRSFIMALHQKHPPQGDAISLAQSAPEYWEKNRSDLFFGQTDQAPASAKTETERPAAPGSPASPVQARDTSRDQFLPEGGEPSSPIDQSAYKQTSPSLAPSSAKTFLGNPTYRDTNPYPNRPSNVLSKMSESMAYIAIDSLMDANAAVNWFAKTSGFTGAMMEASGIADRLSNVNYSPDNPNRREEILNAISGPETRSAPPAASKPAPQKKTTAPSSSGKQPAKKSKAPAVNPPPGFSINP